MKTLLQIIRNLDAVVGDKLAEPMAGVVLGIYAGLLTWFIHPWYLRLAIGFLAANVISFSYEIWIDDHGFEWPDVLWRLPTMVGFLLLMIWLVK